MGNVRLTPAVYRLKGQRGPHPSRALIVEGHPAPEAALAALVGPLAMFASTRAKAHRAAAARPSTGVIEDDGEPPLLGFRGQGPPLRPYDLAGLYRCGWRLIIDIVRLPRGSPDPEGFARVWVTVPRLEVAP